MNVLHVFAWDFHNHPITWEPEDRSHFEFWLTVKVGDGEVGNYYQVHICSPSAMSESRDKKGTFVLTEWSGIESLISTLNAFIEEKLSGEIDADPYELLSKHWLWEYEGYRPAC